MAAFHLFFPPLFLKIVSSSHHLRWQSQATIYVQEKKGRSREWQRSQQTEETFWYNLNSLHPESPPNIRFHVKICMSLRNAFTFRLVWTNENLFDRRNEKRTCAGKIVINALPWFHILLLDFVHTCTCCSTFLLTYMCAGKDDQILALGFRSFATFLSFEMQFCSFTDVIS